MSFSKSEKIFLVIVGIYWVISPFVWAATGQFLHAFLAWNLFLAIIPWLLAKLIVQKTWKKTWMVMALSLAWLLFLPNAFYLITDLIYLSERVYIEQAHLYAEIIYLSHYLDWMVLFHIVSGMFIALFAGCLSLSIMHSKLQVLYSKRKSFWIILSVMGLSSIGIYIGRFFRYNSWDMSRVFTIIKDLVDHFGFDMIFFIGGYTILHLLVYGLFQLTLSIKTMDIKP
jgi:uncharacterized membrane protein